MAPEHEARQVARSTETLGEGLLFEIDAEIGIRTMFEQLLADVERGQAAERPGRGFRFARERCGVPGGARLVKPGERVQRGTTRIPGIRIGAVVEQQRSEVVVGIHHGDVERARAVGRPVLHIGAELKQPAGGIDPVFAHREEECREPRGRLRRDVGACLDERRDRRRVAFGRRPHERSLAAKLLRGVHVCSVLQQRFNRCGRTVQRGVHEERLPFARRRVGIGAGLDQPGQEFRTAARGCQCKRCYAIARSRIDFGARGEQQFRDLERTDPCGMVQSRGAVGVALVGIGAFGEHDAHRSTVFKEDRFEQQRGG